MHKIEGVPVDAHGKVRLLAHAWGISDGEAVARLVDHFARTPDSQPEQATTPDGVAAIYVVYEDTRIDAVFDRKTKAVTVTSGKLKGNTYATPSGAAVAVVSAYNPSVSPSRNGWSFWFLAENGSSLQSIRH